MSAPSDISSVWEELARAGGLRAASGSAPACISWDWHWPMPAG
jgi:hypothetical protein